MPAGPRGDAVAVLGTSLLLGLVGGVLWWLLTEPALFTVGPEGTLGMGEVELADRFSATGWFTVLAAVLGALSGGALTWWRNRDPMLTAGLIVVGSVLATAAMTLVGGLLGPPDPAGAAASATPGQQVPAALEVGATAAYLVWTIAALAGALMVLWSPATDGEP
jgi:hypothetical protein